MAAVYLCGVGMTQFGKFPDASIRSLAEHAVDAALRDASLESHAVQIAIFSNAVGGLLTGQEMIRGQMALRNTGLLGIPMVNIENACASGSSALFLASMAITTGVAEVALVVGAEKLTHRDKSRTLAAIGTAVDLLDEDRSAAAAQVNVVQPDTSERESRSLFMEIYAEQARAYMAATGASPADFARVTVKSHRHAALNPLAQYRDPLSVEGVLASREIAPPLTLLMCSPVGDGAAALVLCSEQFMRQAGLRGVRLAGCVMLSGKDRKADEPSAVERAVANAYEQAGLGPEDLDLVELHDAAASAELVLYEELGICARGEAAGLLADGTTTLGGRLPVNTSGGLLARGHPIGATGCAQIVELVNQLRGCCGSRQVEGARVALAENGGGYLTNDVAAAVVTILTAD